MNKVDKKIPQNKIEQVFRGRSTGLQGCKWIPIDGVDRVPQGDYKFYLCMLPYQYVAIKIKVV